MPTAASPQTFFGMDIRALRPGMARAWQWLGAPLLRWLTPDVAVRWQRADGQLQTWRTDGARWQPLRGRAAAKAVARFVALEPPEALLLRRSVAMPRLPQAALQQAAALEIASSSPFPASDLVYGWVERSGSTRADATITVDLILASRARLQAWTAEQQPAGSPAAELWCPTPGGAPVVLQGFGEARRTQNHARGRAIGSALLMAALLLLLALALTPTLQLRARALQAVAAYDQLGRTAAPAVQQREALTHSQEQLTQLQTLLAGQADPLKVLDMLTQALPDDTSLLSLKLQGLKLTLSGQTGNAAALMQRLGSHPALREVKAPSAATRPPGATKDSFTIEALVDVQALQASPAAQSATSSMPAPTPRPDTKATPQGAGT